MAAATHAGLGLAQQTWQFKSLAAKTCDHTLHIYLIVIFLLSLLLLSSLLHNIYGIPRHPIASLHVSQFLSFHTNTYEPHVLI